MNIVRAQTITVKNIALYLKAHDRFDEACSVQGKGKECICSVLDMLNQMPDANYVLRGSFRLPNYRQDESEIFYIPDMLQMLSLLKENRYADFVHELNDFINFKILHDDIERDISYLPTDIKNALISTIEKGLGTEDENAQAYSQKDSRY